MEIQDERDERWLERDREREAEREATRQSRSRGHTAPAPATGSKAIKGSKKSQKAARRSELARSLGVTVEQLNSAHRAESDATTGLAGVPDKNAKVAKRLGITTSELKVLRKALSGTSVSKTQAASLIRTVAESGARAASPAGGVRPRPAATDASIRRAAGDEPLPATTSVYVTTWGQVVHLHHDCPSARGFRHVGEPDPDLYKVEARDPSCKGRRVCGTCKNRASVLARRIEYLLKSLHGAFYTDAQWRQAFGRPRPNGSLVGGKRKK